MRSPLLSSTRKIYFNAPAMMPADISVYPGRYETLDRNEPTRRPVRTTLFSENSGVDKENRSKVISRKGWLTPDLTYEDDWAEQDVDPESEAGEDNEVDDTGTRSGTRSSGWRPNNPRTGREENNDRQPQVVGEANVSNLFPNNTQYGFRFMYNPPSLDFDIGLASGVNFSYILSGAEKASPMIASGSSISVNLTISRVDDLAVMRSMSPGRLPTTSELNEVLDMYGKWGEGRRSVTSDVNYNNEYQRGQTFMDAESSAKIAQLREIAEHGTMHDMNHLFRAFAAKNWKTAYRGTTADIGIAYSVPLVLYLSDKMIYRVRLAGLSYSHRVFSPDMIPTLTDVSMSFSRIPDVVAWEGAAGPGENLENRS